MRNAFRLLEVSPITAWDVISAKALSMSFAFSFFRGESQMPFPAANKTLAEKASTVKMVFGWQNMVYLLCFFFEKFFLVGFNFFDELLWGNNACFASLHVDCHLSAFGLCRDFACCDIYECVGEA